MVLNKNKGNYFHSGKSLMGRMQAHAPTNRGWVYLTAKSLAPFIKLRVSI
jgi:hypothetical protein